jgi:hydroxyacylglutathione hydrolase
MLVVCSRAPRWLSNTWLVAASEGGEALIVDTGGPTEPIHATIERYALRPAAVLCTHHHPDHVAHNDEYRRRYDVPVVGHASERDLVRGGFDETVVDDEHRSYGALSVRAMHIPGHTLGQLGFVVTPGESDPIAFTGDTLFRRSIGGNRGSGHTTFEDLQRSIRDRLLRLPPKTVLYPGHMETTTVAEEIASNPFVALWEGRRAPEDTPCAFRGAAATLELSAIDYDGGRKCQIRFEDGERAIVPGSRVERAG